MSKSIVETKPIENVDSKNSTDSPKSSLSIEHQHAIERYKKIASHRHRA